MEYHWSVPFKFTPHYWLGRGIRHVAHEVFVPQLPDIELDIDRKALGFGMMAFGAAILAPGPFDAAVGLTGAYFGGPAGAAGAVALYNLTGAGLVVAGYLIYS